MRVSHTSESHGSGSEPLYHASRDKDRHRSGSSTGEQATAENRKRALQWKGRAAPFGVFANSHCADKAAEHEPAETPGVERQSPQSKCGYGHDRSDGEALKSNYDNGEDEPEA